MRSISAHLILAVVGPMSIGGCASERPYLAPQALPVIDAPLVTDTPFASETNGPVAYVSDQVIGAAAPGEGTSRRARDKGYLQRGPVLLGEESAAHAPQTSTERALELEKDNARLSEEIAELKQQVARIQSELEATNSSLVKCIEERMKIRSELAATRSQMTEWERELSSLSELIGERERSHLEDLDEVIALIEKLVEHRATPMPAPPERPRTADTSTLRQDEFKQ